MIFAGEDDLERAQADGRITVHDADEVRNFASFLRAMPAKATGPLTADEREQMRRALWEHYPDQYPELAPERNDP